VKTTKKLVLTGIFSAMGFVLMLLEFPLAFVIPDFIKFDFSELPALICTFACGPLYGGAVCLIKNALHLLIGHTGGIGELANFLMGAAFVITAGIIYKNHKSKLGALASCLIGSAVGAAVSLPLNLFVTYPFYMRFMSEEAIIGAYRLILPSVASLKSALLIFNLPFTFVKFLSDSLITFVIYKRISPLLKRF